MSTSHQSTDPSVEEKTVGLPTKPSSDDGNTVQSPTVPESGPKTPRIEVTWDGESDPENPQHWTRLRKTINIGIVSALAFIP